MKMIKAILAFAVALVAITGQAGDSSPFPVDTVLSPTVDSILVSWDVAWIGGDTNAMVVISDNGNEVRRVAGTGVFTYTPSTIGRHELTYRTYIGGIVQDEIYSASVFAKWKYELVDGGAVITETTQMSGVVDIPHEIDGKFHDSVCRYRGQYFVGEPQMLILRLLGGKVTHGANQRQNGWNINNRVSHVNLFVGSVCEDKDF